MSEAQKKQIKNRLKNRLEKTYILTFNRDESIFYEEEKVDAMSGATDSWGSGPCEGQTIQKCFGESIIQSQEFYGKNSSLRVKLQEIKWKMESESKQIGNYLCFRLQLLFLQKNFLGSIFLGGFK